jgi:putative ABC transport system ATP-binding protein
MTDAGRLFEFVHVSLPGLDGQWRLRDVNGWIPASGVTVLVGRSGSGKSTLLRCCNRLEAPTEGVVEFRGHDVAALEVLGHRRRVAMVFQHPTPFPGTGRENLAVADPTVTDGEGRALLARVGLGAEFLDRTATELSGGEAQRLCLARALAVNPQVLLMDEVTSSVDPLARRSLEALARSLAHDGTPVVWVTHDFAQAHRLADTLLVMIDGHLANPSEADAFLAEGHYDE